MPSPWVAPGPPDCLGVQPLSQAGDETLMQGTGPAVVVAVAIVGVEDCLDPAGGGVLVAAVRDALLGVRRRSGAQRSPVMSVLHPCPGALPWSGAADIMPQSSLFAQPGAPVSSAHLANTIL